MPVTLEMKAMLAIGGAKLKPVSFITHHAVPLVHQHLQEKHASGTLVAARAYLGLSNELCSTVAVVPGGEITFLFARHRQQRRNKQQKGQPRRPPQQQQSRNSATNAVNYCLLVLFVFILAVWVFIVCMPPGKKRKKRKIWSSSGKSSTHNLNFVSLIAVLFLGAPPVHSICEASNTLAMEQMAQAQATQFQLAAAPAAPSPFSSDTFGHYGINNILCLGPIEDVVQRACAHVKIKGYEHIGEGALL